MKTLNWKVVSMAVISMFLTTACSKKLMPPEIQTSNEVSEGTEFTPPSGDSGASGTGGPEDSGFFSEEPILEHGSSSSGGLSSADGSTNGANGSGGGSGANIHAGSGNGDFGSSGQADIGNGSTGSFSANPFSSGENGSGSGSGFGNGSGFGSGSGSGNGSGMGGGIQESRLKSFEATTKLKDIHFKYDKHDLDDNSRMVLKENAEFLKSNPSLHIEIQGHCDERGTNNYNIALGERRAYSTKKYLVSQGVDSKKVHVISFGEEKPFCFASEESCWSQNRRAHFMVSK